MRRLSPATRRYLLRMFGFSAAYVAVLFAVARASDAGVLPEGPPRYLIAAAPALPVIGVIWAMMRFSDEEEDEFQRYLHNRAILWALGLTLGACVLGGLMQRFAGMRPSNLLDVFSFFWLSQLFTTVWVQVRGGR